MLVQGKFTMISVDIRESNGKMYHNVNIEAEDGKLLRIGMDPQVLNSLQKYQLHNGDFEVGTYNNNMYMRLVGATLVSPVSAPVASDPAPVASDPAPVASDPASAARGKK